MHQYLTNLLNRFAKIFILFIFLGPNIIWAQTIFSTLEASNQLSKEAYPNLIKKYSNKNFQLKNVKEINKVIFHPIFVNTLLFYNTNSVLNLGIHDRCSMIDLMGTDLLHSPSGMLENVLIQFENQKGVVETHAMKKDQFLQTIGYKQCPKSQDLKKHFSPRNLRKTLKGLKIKSPNSVAECREFHKDFIHDVKSPFLCDISKKVKDLKYKKIQLKNTSQSNYRKYQSLKKEVEVAESYTKILNSDSLDYLNQFCGFDNAGKMCNAFFAINYWQNAIKKVKDDSALKYYCEHHLQKMSVNTAQMKKCAQSLSYNEKLCAYLSDERESLLPKPLCIELSKTLNNSRLVQNYNDCPARSGSDSLTLASRILLHIDKKIPQIPPGNCEAYSTYSFSQFNQEFLENLYWQVQLCYDDKIQRKKVCFPTLLNEVNESELSLSSNIEKILARLRGLNRETQSCKVIDVNAYRPSLLEFKTGCYILKDFNQCYGTDCKFKVIFDDMVFDKYTFEQNLQFDILPFRYTDENKSFIKLLERYKKKQVKEIFNISSFNYIFEKHKDAIFFGMGCAENLLPAYFKTHSVNQCTFLPFLVDGIQEENGHYALVTRTSYDQIHAPRLIPWPYIFSAIKNYQKHQPLDQWSFYAIY